MASPLNPVMAPAVTYEYLFCLPLSERLRTPAQWKARDLLSGSCTPGTVGHRLRLINLDTTDSLQRQTGEKSHTPYRILPHHSWLKGRGHLPKKNLIQE
jgi:hypothetical protein